MFVAFNDYRSRLRLRPLAARNPELRLEFRDTFVPCPYLGGLLALRLFQSLQALEDDLQFGSVLRVGRPCAKQARCKKA